MIKFVTDSCLDFMKFIFVFSQVHTNFRLAEMESICNLYGIPCDNNISLLCNKRHVYVFEFPSFDDVTKILSRSVLIKTTIQPINLLLYACDPLEENAAAPLLKI